MFTSSSIPVIFCRWSTPRASSPLAAVATSYPCCTRKRPNALRIDSSSSTTSRVVGSLVRDTQTPALGSAEAGDRARGVERLRGYSEARRWSGWAPAHASPNELHRHAFRNQVDLERPVQQKLHRGPAPGAVIHRPLIHVHAHEGVGALVSDAAVELLGMRQRRGPMLQAVHDAGPQVSGNLPQDVRTEVAADRVAPQRQGQTGLLLPPGPEVGPEVQAGVAEGELPFVNEKPNLDVLPVDGVFDPVERHHFGDAVPLVELERQIGGGELARNRDSPPPEGG